jgi:putative endonuclease
VEAKQFKTKKRHYVYIVRCADGTFYTGWTTNIPYRLRVHNAGKGAKYTKSRLPAELVYWEAFNSKREAMKREYQIKRLSRAKKLEMINDN